MKSTLITVLRGPPRFDFQFNLICYRSLLLHDFSLSASLDSIVDHVNSDVLSTSGVSTLQSPCLLIPTIPESYKVGTTVTHRWKVQKSKFRNVKSLPQDVQ